MIDSGFSYPGMSGARFQHTVRRTPANSASTLRMTSSRQLMRCRLSSNSLGQPRMNICSCGGRLAICSYRLAMAASSGVWSGAVSAP